MKWYSGIDGVERVLRGGVLAVAAMCVVFGSFLITVGIDIR